MAKITWRGMNNLEPKRFVTASETAQPRFEFDNVKPQLKSGIFECISSLNGSFSGVMIGIFWKRA